MTGLVLLDKPQGMSSFSAVRQVSRVFGEKRAGHTGTLDPMATGVLPVLLGRATRLSGMLLEADKRYRADLLLGTVTDTLDITGNVISEQSVSVDDGRLLDALSEFKGVITQTTPAFSAIKQGGVRMYELARKGIEVDLPQRQVEIKQLDLLSRRGDTVTIDVVCSKGTYIRSLAHDIGKALGCGATLSALRRTATGGFGIDRCVTLEQLKSDPEGSLLDAGECVAHMKAVEITDSQRNRFLNGGSLFTERTQCSQTIFEGDACRVYDKNGRLLGIADASGDSLMVRCLIFEGDV